MIIYDYELSFQQNDGNIIPIVILMFYMEQFRCKLKCFLSLRGIVVLLVKTVTIVRLNIMNN